MKYASHEAGEARWRRLGGLGSVAAARGRRSSGAAARWPRKATLSGNRKVIVARLGREAARRHVSVGSLVRQAVDATYPEELELRRAARQRSQLVLGAFDSGRSDISERHDELLGEAIW